MKRKLIGQKSREIACVLLMNANMPWTIEVVVSDLSLWDQNWGKVIIKS